MSDAPKPLPIRVPPVGRVVEMPLEVVRVFSGDAPLVELFPLPPGWSPVTDADGKELLQGDDDASDDALQDWFSRLNVVQNKAAELAAQSPDMFRTWWQAVTESASGEHGVDVLPPTDIDVDTLELVHRHQDGWITFCRNVNGKMDTLAGIRANKLREYIPKLLPFLIRDAYFSLNASYRAYPERVPETGLLRGDRREISMRYLNACYLDVDSYKASPPMEWPMNLAAVLEAAESDVVPPPSIIVRSGRGLYLIWLLHHGENQGMQTAKPWEIAYYKQVNAALGKRLAEYNSRLGVDDVFDAARLLRVFGSLNSKSREPVLAQVQVTARGLAPTYALDELGEFAGVPRLLPDDHYAKIFGRQIKERGSCPGRRQGPIALARHRAGDVIAIAQDMNGFPQGMRGRSLAYLAEFMRWGGWTLSETTSTLEHIAATCRPPYPTPGDGNDIPPDRIALAAFNETIRRRHRGERLAHYFNVTDEQAERLGLASIIPETTRDKRKLAPSPREQRKRDRQALIREMIDAHPGDYPSLREMRRRLDESHGIRASHETIRHDVGDILAQVRRERRRAKGVH